MPLITIHHAGSCSQLFTCEVTRIIGNQLPLHQNEAHDGLCAMLGSDCLASAVARALTLSGTATSPPHVFKQGSEGLQEPSLRTNYTPG